MRLSFLELSFLSSAIRSIQLQLKKVFVKIIPLLDFKRRLFARYLYQHTSAMKINMFLVNYCSACFFDSYWWSGKWFVKSATIINVKRYFKIVFKHFRLLLIHFCTAVGGSIYNSQVSKEYGSYILSICRSRLDNFLLSTHRFWCPAS